MKVLPKFSRGQWIWLGVLGVGSFVGGVVAARYGMDETGAAWTQAVLSAAAIFAAVWLQDRDRIRRRRESETRHLIALESVFSHSLSMFNAIIKERSKEGSSTLALRNMRSQLQDDLEIVKNFNIVELPRREDTISASALRSELSAMILMLDTIVDKMEAGVDVSKAKLGGGRERLQKYHNSIRDQLKTLGIIVPEITLPNLSDA